MSEDEVRGTDGGTVSGQGDAIHLQLGNEVIVATSNAGKAKEFAIAFAELGKQTRTLRDYPGFPEIVEDGKTFADNARIKAKAVGIKLGIPALADDSGLAVDLLGGEPGVYSARYAGEGAADADNNAKLLAELAERGGQAADAALQRAWALNPGELPPGGAALLSAARFHCALALYDPATDSFIEAAGDAPGYILDRPLGDGGFGYDPLFWLPELGASMAQLSLQQKQQISHRGAALRQLLDKLRG